MAVNAPVAKQGFADRLKLALAGAMLVAGIAGFYVLSNQAQVVRVVAAERLGRCIPLGPVMEVVDAAIADRDLWD